MFGAVTGILRRGLSTVAQAAQIGALSATDDADTLRSFIYTVYQNHFYSQPSQTPLLDSYQNTQHRTRYPQPPTLKLLLPALILLATLFMASNMSGFISRLMRPFSSGPMRFGAEGAAQTYPEGSKKATVAAGCFWGVEHMYRRAFANQGLIDAKVGYIGGDSKNPSYRSVCSGRTGRECVLAPTSG